MSFEQFLSLQPHLLSHKRLIIFVIINETEGNTEENEEKEDDIVRLFNHILLLLQWSLEWRKRKTHICDQRKKRTVSPSLSLTALESMWQQDSRTKSRKESWTEITGEHIWQAWKSEGRGMIIIILFFPDHHEEKEGRRRWREINFNSLLWINWLPRVLLCLSLSLFLPWLFLVYSSKEERDCFVIRLRTHRKV